MTHSGSTGRTPWDFASDVLRPAIVKWSFAVLFFAVPAGVHFLAEPGSEVSYFFGLLKYQKAKMTVFPVQPASPMAAMTGDYALPLAKDFTDTPTPILDGTINLGSARVAAGWAYFVSGANINQIALAVRSLDGEAIIPKTVGTRVLIEKKDTVLELEYKGNYFVINTEDQRGDEGTFVYSVKQIKSPTLQLKKIIDY